jgi:hypothetical protein
MHGEKLRKPASSIIFQQVSKTHEPDTTLLQIYQECCERYNELHDQTKTLFQRERSVKEREVNQE